MRRSLAVLTIAVLALVKAPVSANEPLVGLFRDYLESLRVQAGIPGLSAALIGRDEIIWEHAFGWADIGRAVETTTDTPFHVDGVTQLFTATMVLQCVEAGLFALDTPIGQFSPRSSDPEATFRQILTHTLGDPDDPVFSYSPDRFSLLPPAIRRGCAGNSFRETLANQLELLGMSESVPGPDVLRLVPPAEGIPTASQKERYQLTLARLATPYSVNSQKRASPSRYPATTLTGAGGLITTVQDYAKFDLALKRRWLLKAQTLALAWQAPVTRTGQRLPHGVGWFVQTYNGETIVWQFGVGDNASSSLVMSVPGRGLTLILLANSSGLVKPSALDDGDLRASPFGRLFLGLLVR
jgi:CubicO group peptidase (beta-lactamase class C family)